MEAPFNPHDKLIKNLFKEAPLEKPSIDFSKKVMQQIEKTKMYQPYRPLISKKTWMGIAAVFILGLVWVYMNPSSSIYNEVNYNFAEQINLKNPFEGFSLSKTTTYAIGFMALFFFQIPVLKRILEKKYV